MRPRSKIMLEISPKSNLLEQKSYKYSLQDVPEPNLYREVYNYEEVPKVPFNHRRVPLGMPADIWITDTTFRDGMQSQAPYSPTQITDIYKMLARRPEGNNPHDRVLCLQRERPQGAQRLP